MVTMNAGPMAYLIIILLLHHLMQNVLKPSYLSTQCEPASFRHATKPQICFYAYLPKSSEE